MSSESTMPVAGVTAMLRMAAPQHAAGVLMSMPADRVRAVLAEMEPAVVVRILTATTLQRSATLLAALSSDRAALVLGAMAVRRAAETLALMPVDRVTAALTGVSPDRAQTLLSALRPAPDPVADPVAVSAAVPVAVPVATSVAVPVATAVAITAQEAVPVVSRPAQVPASATRSGSASARGSASPRVASASPTPPGSVPGEVEDVAMLRYEQGVARVLGSTSAQFVASGENLPHCLLIRIFNCLIAVTVDYREHLSLGLPDLYAAEATALHAKADAALTVTNRALPDAVVGYNNAAANQGRPVAAVTWVDSRDDGLLQRALVRLVR